MQKLSQWILSNTGWMYENSGFPRSDKITQNHEWWKIRMMEDIMNLRVFVGLGLLLRSFHQEEELPHPGEEAWLRNSLANAVGHMHMDGESWTVIRRSKIYVRFYKWLIQIRWRCQWVFLMSTFLLEPRCQAWRIFSWLTKLDRFWFFRFHSLEENPRWLILCGILSNSLFFVEYHEHIFSFRNPLFSIDMEPMVPTRHSM